MAAGSMRLAVVFPPCFRSLHTSADIKKSREASRLQCHSPRYRLGGPHVARTNRASTSDLRRASSGVELAGRLSAAEKLGHRDDIPKGRVAIPSPEHFDAYETNLSMSW